MIYLRYHEREWRFDAASKELVAVGGVRIPLCSERRPQEGAAPIVRIGEAEWQIAPCRYRKGFFKKEDPEFIRLLGTPESVSDLFRELL